MNKKKYSRRFRLQYNGDCRIDKNGKKDIRNVINNN